MLLLLLPLLLLLLMLLLQFVGGWGLIRKNLLGRSPSKRASVRV